MGPQRPRSLARTALLLAAPLLACPFPAAPLHAQVFVVGMKTATADVVTDFHPTHVDLPTEPLTERGHLDLIRNLEAEQGFAHRELPLGGGLTLLANGNMTPGNEAYKAMLYQKGVSASPGDRVEVTALQFKPGRIVIDFNGGPYAKHRFLSHISFGNTPIAQLGPVATGFRLTLAFEGDVPDLTAAEVKALLDPIIDFKARSSNEAYTNTLTPKVRDSIEAHEILVGMDRRMVIASAGEPKTKHREHVAVATGATSIDANDPFIEEWIYGDPPQPTRFVRFKDGRVVRLEIAALGKPLDVHDKNEMDMTPAPALLARTIANGDAQPDKEEAHQRTAPPTLRRPGDPVDDTSPATTGRVNLQGDTPASNQPASSSTIPPASESGSQPGSQTGSQPPHQPGYPPDPDITAPPKLPFVSQPSR